MKKSFGIKTLLSIITIYFINIGTVSYGEPINKPLSIYAEYRNLIIGNILLLLALIDFIIFLILDIRKRKKIELELKLANDALFEVYEEIAASDEQLKNQYYELEKSRNIIKKNEQRYRLIAEASNDGFWDMDIRSEEVFSNERLSQVLGLDREEANNYINNLDKYVHINDLKKVHKIIDEIKIGVRDNYNVEYRTLNKNGKYKWILAKGRLLRDEEGKVYRVIGFHIDIEDRKVQQEQIRTLAYYDIVTGLANRTMFYETMEGILRKSRESNTSGALLYMDIDNFKIINDTFGHILGDMILKEVAKRLRKVMNKHDNIFRLSGDEYILILEGYDKAKAENMFFKVQNILSEPILIDGNKIRISISSGIIFYPKDASSVEEAFRKVDLAMYKAKELGKNCYKIYEQSMEEEVENRLLLENSIRSAIDKGEFVLNYQPQVNIKDNRTVGFEALIRWYSPEYGFVSPMKFITIAEETGIITKIGEWVLREACKFAVKINEESDSEIVVSVNISSIQLNQDNFIEIVQGVVRETGINPKILGIEITETSLMELFEENSEKLEELEDMGITVYLDDFGTGYSSLNYLLKLPIHSIKIDRSFVTDMMTDERGVKITESIINLAHNMGLSVTAEGVETEEQLQLLKELKCDIIQGYIFGKPLCEEDVIKYIQIK